jgi:hypothetical protein
MSVVLVGLQYTGTTFQTVRPDITNRLESNALCLTHLRLQDGVVYQSAALFPQAYQSHIYVIGLARLGLAQNRWVEYQTGSYACRRLQKPTPVYALSRACAASFAISHDGKYLHA